MQIRSVDALVVRMPLKTPLQMAVATVEARACLIVRITSDEGVEGVGEAVLAPYFTGETSASALALVRDVADRLLIGQDPGEIGRLNGLFRSYTVGNTAARCAVDIALHDLLARSLDVPLYRLLGGTAGTRVRTTWHLSSSDVEQNARDAETAAGEGYSLFKVKVGKGAFAHELADVRAVREAVGHDADIVLDANQGWRPPEAVRFLDAVRDQHVLFLEQPVHRSDVRGMAWVQARTDVPIIPDEGVSGAEDLLEYLRLDAVQGVVGKLMKSSGIAGMVHLTSLAATAGIDTYLAGMPGETSIAAAAALHVAATLGPLRFGTGISPQSSEDDVVREPIEPVDGLLHTPSGPGLGVSLDEDAVDRLRIA